MWKRRGVVGAAVVIVAGYAQELPRYDVQRAASKIVIDGKLDDAAWQGARPVGDFVFNWWTAGEKEPTVAKLLWDDENLYVSWLAKDRHISAYETRRHGPVSKDDCVEIFISPNPQKPRNYYTFEINAIGTMLNRARTDWWQGPPTWEPEGVVYRTTFHGLPKKDESPEDREWAVEMAIPLRNFARDAAHTPPREGDVWRLNLNRLGGKTNAQSSTWSPIAPPSKTFHTPESFGRVTFRGGTAERARQAAEGRELYNRSCTMCHGMNGTAGDRAPALAGQRRFSRSREEDLFQAIKHGIGGTLMPPTALPDADVWKIVAYIRSLRATAAETPTAGDPAAGEKVFFGKGNCNACHMVNGRGGLLGPDLSNVAAERSVSFLERALTAARADIPRGYQPVRAVTADGQSIEGVVKNENNFSLQVLDGAGKIHLLARNELREIEYRKSLMPSDYDRVLSKSEFQDLLAYLSRLAKEGGARNEVRRNSISR